MNRREDEGPGRLAVLLILFLALGPLGLGLLWRSQRFQRREKVLLTILVVVYTLLLAAAFYLVARYVYRMVATVMSL